jgi:hypothetical protein
MAGTTQPTSETAPAPLTAAQSAAIEALRHGVYMLAHLANGNEGAARLHQLAADAHVRLAMVLR